MVKKIALISEHASPLADPGSVDSGGQNVYVAQVAKQLAKNGYQVDVFTRCDDSSLPDIFIWEDGIRVIHVPAGPPEFTAKENLLPYMKPFTNFMIEFIMRQGKPYDLIHANFWMSALVAADIKKALGIPFVVTFHALGRVRREYQGENDGFPDVRFEIEERIVQEADYIIAECPQDEQDLTTLYGAVPEKLVIIPCGFDSAEMGPIDKMQARKELGLAEDENIILQLGRIVPRKGVETVIRGLARLVYDQGIEARLLVVGGNSEDPDPKKTPEIGRLQAIAAKEKVSDRVTFVGRRGREVLKHFYSAADVFVSTPWYEPFGITPVEAMACGTPVIGSRVGGIQYTVADGETGFLISPRDDVALGDHLARIFQDDELLGQLSRNAIERVNRLFTWKQVGDSIAKLYDQAIKEAKQVTIMEAKENKNTSSTELAVDPVRSQQVDIIERNFKTAVKVMQLSRDGLREPVLETARSMINTLVRGGKVMVAGNGGSAADAQHFAAEFVGRFMYPDRQGLPVMALTADTAFLTAWSNDVSYDKVFSRQVETFGQPGDMLIGISTSGRSCNLIEAFEVASSKGITCVGLLGGDGGELLQLADIAIVVPSANAQRIQEVQIVVLHTLSELVEAHFVSTPSLLARLGASSRSSWDMQPGIPVELPGRK